MMEKVANITEKERIPTRTIRVVDYTGALAEGLNRQFAQYNQENPNKPIELEFVPPEDEDTDQLAQQIRDGKIYAYLILPKEIIDGNEPCTFGRKDNRLRAGRVIQNAVNSAVVDQRFARHDPPINPAVIQGLQRPVGVTSIDVATGEQSAGNEMARVMTPFAFMFLLFMGTFGISQGLLTSVIEEKSSRVIEVLLSAVSPLELMSGKILGTVCVGILLIGVWGAVGYTAATMREMSYLVTPYRLTLTVMYFIPGFLLFSSMLAAIGSACNTLKEAQSMVGPLSIMTAIPMVMWFPISQNPGSALSLVLSYIPPLTPMIMVLRICVDPDTPMIQVVTTLVVLWLSVFFAIWAAAKVFRIGVLMYGKPPSVRELLHWVRYT
jgi:ABC-2 type transport system permease protein